MTNLSSLSPVAVDTIYLERIRRLDSAQREAKYATYPLTRAFGKDVYVGGSHFGRYRRPEAVAVHPDAVIPAGKGDYGTAVWSLSSIDLKPLTAEDVIEAATAGHPKAAGLADKIAAYEDAVSKLADARLAVEEVEDEFKSRPWSRYWLVTTSDGHIHRSTCCSTCNKGRSSTGFALVPYLSGSASTDAVADLGPALCSVCFSDAPVESKEQSRIPARLALALREEGSEAFLKARQEAAEKTKAKAADRCPGSGERVEYSPRHRVYCPACGCGVRSTTGKIPAHRRPRYYAVRIDENVYGDKYWNGQSFGPSTKKVAFETQEAALAVPGVTKVLRD